MSSPPKPRLVAVADEEAAPASAPEARESGGRRRLLAWIVGAVVVGAAVGALWFQAQRVAALDAQVRDLTAELSATQTALSAYEARMGQVRAAVTDLGAQVSALDELIASDPAEPR